MSKKAKVTFEMTIVAKNKGKGKLKDIFKERDVRGDFAIYAKNNEVPFKYTTYLFTDEPVPNIGDFWPPVRIDIPKNGCSRWKLVYFITPTPSEKQKQNMFIVWTNASELGDIVNDADVNVFVFEQVEMPDENNDKYIGCANNDCSLD